MGLFGRNKTVQGTSDSAQVPVKKNVMRVTYTADNGDTRLHDVVIDAKNSNDFSVRHVIASTVDDVAKIHSVRKVGEEY